MTTPFTHAFAGFAAGKIFAPKKMPVRFWVLSAICPVVPDIDGIGHMMGVPYEHFFGHRGFFHSPFFALLVGLAVTAVFFSKGSAFSKRWWLLVLYFLFITATHGILDAMTDGGLGVAFLSPVSNARFFLPLRPFAVGPIGIMEFLNLWGLFLVVSEIFFILVPVSFAFVLSYVIRAIILSRRARLHSQAQSKNHQS
ncbi:MAG: metal-dependent hydrolase [Planctomycetota bacterium]|nr:MAG: metal-dependent hydrolase [Planctomycetota bacterium]